MALGWIYVLSNDAMPGLVKIGQSASDPILRAQELETTGVPGSFCVEYKGLFDRYETLERAVHLHLSEHRVSNRREFFRLAPGDAVQAIRDVSDEPAKFEEATDKSFWIPEQEELGYCRTCGVVVAKAAKKCLRCGAVRPAD